MFLGRNTYGGDEDNLGDTGSLGGWFPDQPEPIGVVAYMARVAGSQVNPEHEDGVISSEVQSVSAELLAKLAS